MYGSDGGRKEIVVGLSSSVKKKDLSERLQGSRNSDTSVREAPQRVRACKSFLLHHRSCILFLSPCHLRPCYLVATGPLDIDTSKGRDTIFA